MTRMTRPSTRPSIRPFAHRAALVTAAATAALLLAACGGGADTDRGAEASPGAGATASTGAAAPDAAHNAQDVAFAQGMIPHHRQALEMARLVADRSASAEVKDLGTRIEQAQAPEIRTMTGWLTSWGEEVPEPADTASGTDHSEHTAMPGMMDAEDMAALGKASGAAFDRLFLTLMVEHHEGAVEMATAEREKGRFGPARKMAESVVTAQSAEIAEMNRLLGSGSGDTSG
ncbi:DUF305 domain-containing protein [Streptomyces poriticola]|uniref:DUF305 domain-containing protein n=1 Tax=Streptomyces poriticola TaxID=3120506 RepID=UPI002FCDF1F0